MFDYNLMYENIKTIAAYKQVKMGDLEQEIGLSKGYFSRTANGSRTATVEKIYKAAEILGVAVDTLLHELPKISREACPFCGGEPAIEEGGLEGYEAYYAVCPNCGAHGPEEASPESAEAAWNKRIYGDYEEPYDWGKIFKEQKP